MLKVDDMLWLCVTQNFGTTKIRKNTLLFCLIYAKFGEFHKIFGNNDCSHSFHKRRSLQLVDFKNLFEDCT